MSQSEIIEEMKKLPADQIRKVVEAAMKLLSDEDMSALRQKQREDLKEKMRRSAERLRDYYRPGSEHLVGEALDEKDFHDPQ